MSVELQDGVYNFNSVNDWYLTHDGVNVINKGQGGQATSKHIILDFVTEAEMEAAIINLSLIESEE